MEKHFKRTLITTALPYANGPVHIGHLAGVYVPADIYARYLRLKGEEVLMIGGSDEHGVPITLQNRTCFNGETGWLRNNISVPEGRFFYTQKYF